MNFDNINMLKVTAIILNKVITGKNFHFDLGCGFCDQTTLIFMILFIFFNILFMLSPKS